MLYSVVDDRSGVTYQQYHMVRGEEVESALRFLFDAMSPKKTEGFPFQGVPEMIYMDNGPIAKSHLFRRVMKYLNIDIRCHMPKNKGGRRVTARSKGKVERPFLQIKKMHESLYHFHKPRDLEEANQWLLNFLLRYNESQHRLESHSRIEDWVNNLPANGYNQMCNWDRYCSFAREPEFRVVGQDALVTVNGVPYEIDHELAGQKVKLWWGIFDTELYVEFEEKKYGPYSPGGAPIPLHHYRNLRKTKTEKQAEKIEKLAMQLELPIEVLSEDPRSKMIISQMPTGIPAKMFDDPDPFDELSFPNTITAKLAISDYLGKPLALLDEEKLEEINQILNTTLVKRQVISRVRQLFIQDKKSQMEM